MIEFACGHYFINGYVRTATGGYFAAFTPEPMALRGDAVKAAERWATSHRLSEVLTRGFDPTTLIER